MSILLFTTERSRAPVATILSTAVARAIFGLLIAAAVIAGFLATRAGVTQAAVVAAGPDLTRLLRLMMLLKAAMAAAACGAMLWRLGWPVSAGWFAAYVVAGVCMVAGPGLIWDMAHVKLGALLLHAGLAATVVLLWRDPTVAQALGDLVKRRVARRRASLKPSAPAARARPAGR